MNHLKVCELRLAFCIFWMLYPQSLGDVFLRSVDLPTSLRSIGQYAFFECALTLLVIPTSVSFIDAVQIVVCGSWFVHNNCVFAVRFQPECRFAECVTSHLFDYNYGWRFQQLLQPHISYHSNVSPQKLIFIFTFIATIELNWFAVISNYHNNSFFIHTLWLSSFVIGQLLRWARTLSKVSRSMIM